MPGAVFEGAVTGHRRLTPLDYDRNIFDIQIDITGTGLTYTMGDALAVYPQNDAARARTFLAAAYGASADDFGQPSKKFYASLGAIAAAAAAASGDAELAKA